MSDVNPNDPIGAVQALFTELMKTIGLARALAEAGRAIDLTSLDHRIGLLCAKSLDLPPDVGRHMRPRLIALDGALEALSRAVTKRTAPSG
jgi:hypothetical protein